MDTSPDVTVWFKGADGERQAIRVDSRDTHGTYAVIESVATPGCAAPTHSHRHEEEHFLVISGHYELPLATRFSTHRPELVRQSLETHRTAGGISPRRKAGC
jgi:mannose-6-phosphate isomerase-like protein (cupin superfamily)